MGTLHRAAHYSSSTNSAAQRALTLYLDRSSASASTSLASVRDTSTTFIPEKGAPGEVLGGWEVFDDHPVLNY